MNTTDKNTENGGDEELDLESIDEAVQNTSDEIPNEPEVDAETENLTAWDEPTDLSGGEVLRIPLEDEVPAAEQLVEEGLEEADHEQRIAAVDPDYEP